MKFLGRSLGCASVVVFGYLSACGCARAAEPTTADGMKSVATYCRCADEGATDRIQQILNEPLKSAGLDFSQEPLENVVKFLQEEYKLPMQIDVPALEDARLTSDEKVTLQIANISLKAALRLMLRSLNLTYVIRDEVLIITTPEEAESELTTCVYDVRDILALQMLPVQKGAPAGPDYDPLTDVILSVATETWAESGGGEAEIRPLPPGLLVISQTRAVHDEVGALLTTVRETLRQPAPPPLGKAVNAMGAMSDGTEGRGMGRATEQLESGGMEGGREMGPEPTPANESLFD